MDMFTKGIVEVAEKQPSTEEKILDAAERCFEQFGIAKTTIKDVANAAGVSPMTIYRKFADRDALFSATSLRLLDRRWAGIAAKLKGTSELDTWLLEALILNWRTMQGEPQLLRYQQMGAHEEGMTVLLSEPGLRCVYRHFSHLVPDEAPQAADYLRDVAEWLHWMSYIMATGRTTRLTTETDWRRWLQLQIAAGVAQS